MSIVMNERKECRECRWFSTTIPWWDWIGIDPGIRHLIIGRCFRARDNYGEYPIKAIEERQRKSCEYVKRA